MPFDHAYRRRVAPSLSSLTFAAVVSCAVLCFGSVASPVLAAPAARAAKHVAVTETVRAHLLHHRGGTELYDAGTLTGTYSCPLSIKITIAYTQATITFVCRASGGTFNGHGTTSYYASGRLAHFEGTLSVTSGNGKFAHVSSQGLRIRGTLVRGSYALTASVVGGLTL
jgi:hypothetical protein